MGSLAALEQLGLANNQLSGVIPRELGSLSRLMFLNLEKNQLGGSVPEELGNATALIGLLLSSNRLGGTIPGSFLNLGNLQTLWLDHNRFTGPVPFELGALPGLDDNGGLDLRFNALATDTEPGLLADLNLKQAGENWTSSQAASAPFDPQLGLYGLNDRRPGGFVYWTLPIGAGAPPLTVSISPGNGNGDLYVRFGAPPTLTQYDAVSANSGNQDSVTVASPRQGTYYIGLYAHSPYTGVNLQIGGLNGCFSGATTLCLGGGRFKVETTWRTRDGRTGQGHAVPLTGDTGYFWFFDASNVEMVLKVLNACGVNQKYWVFAGGLTDVQVDITVTDTQAGTVRTYHNPQGTAFQPIQDTSAFDACNGGGGNAVAATRQPRGGDHGGPREDPRQATDKATCAAGPTSLCLSGGRFRVDVTWRTPDGRTGAGQAVPLTADTGYFWFFDAANVEMVIKVLNACGFNSRFWVYAGGLTNVQVNVTAHRHDDRDGEDLHEPAGHRVQADPGHVGVLDVPVRVRTGRLLRRIASREYHLRPSWPPPLILENPSTARSSTARSAGAVWRLAWPTMLQNVIGGLQGIVDHVMVGHFVGYTGNAAIGVSLADLHRRHRLHQLAVHRDERARRPLRRRERAGEGQPRSSTRRS